MGTTLEAIERDAGLPAQAESAVHVSDLVKTFPAPGGGTMTAVDHVSFTVQRGEIFGFLGPNGAGKTTVLEIIEGLQAPTAGRTTVLGLDSQHDRERVKQRIGVQLQAGAYFDYLTLEEILDLFGSTTHYMEEAQVLCDHVAIIDHGKIQALDTTSGLI
ncbi:MAG TPA: ATP-binding cassette domain-containing protein, partial [Chloroflexota bacterium]|nr:ATP-binding cassette domain-containing protein [Chloroflexota bacterium]